MAKPKLITGLFKNRLAAEAAVDALLKRGYTRDDISVLMSDATKSKEFALQARTHAADGAGVGGALGGVVGATLAAIVAVGSTIVLPGLNLDYRWSDCGGTCGCRCGCCDGRCYRRSDWRRHTRVSRQGLRSRFVERRHTSGSGN